MEHVDIAVRVMGALLRLARDEDGFSLVELLVAIALGGIVLAAALVFFTTGVTSSAQVQDRSDAAQRARIGFDRVTSLLQAQVCNGVGDTGTPVVAGDGDSVTFTAAVDNIDDPPTGYKLRYLPSTQQLWVDSYTLGSEDPNTGFRSWPTNPVRSEQLMQRVVADGTTHPFRYYGTDDTTTGDPVELGSSAALTTAERPRVLRIDLTLRALPTRTNTTNDRPATLLSTQSYVGSNIVQSRLDEGPRC